MIKKKIYELLLILYRYLGRVLAGKNERDYRKAQKMVEKLRNIGIIACTGADIWPPKNPGDVMIDKESMLEFIQKKRR